MWTIKERSSYQSIQSLNVERSTWRSGTTTFASTMKLATLISSTFQLMTCSPMLSQRVFRLPTSPSSVMVLDCALSLRQCGLSGSVELQTIRVTPDRTHGAYMRVYLTISGLLYYTAWLEVPASTGMFRIVPVQSTLPRNVLDIMTHMPYGAILAPFLTHRSVIRLLSITVAICDSFLRLHMHWSL